MQAFSLDFNLRSHMKTHSQENYHICPYPDCGKRYAHEYKLKNHIMSHHEKVRSFFSKILIVALFCIVFCLVTNIYFSYISGFEGISNPDSLLNISFSLAITKPFLS